MREPAPEDVGSRARAAALSSSVRARSMRAGPDATPQEGARASSDSCAAAPDASETAARGRQAGDEGPHGRASGGATVGDEVTVLTLSTVRRLIRERHPQREQPAEALCARGRSLRAGASTCRRRRPASKTHRSAPERPRRVLDERRQRGGAAAVSDVSSRPWASGRPKRCSSRTRRRVEGMRVAGQAGEQEVRVGQRLGGLPKRSPTLKSSKKYWPPLTSRSRTAREPPPASRRRTDAPQRGEPGRPVEYQAGALELHQREALGQVRVDQRAWRAMIAGPLGAAHRGARKIQGCRARRVRSSRRAAGAATIGARRHAAHIAVADAPPRRRDHGRDHLPRHAP